MKRIITMLWDCLACLVAACPLVLLVAPPAYAYVDPSVMTYTIQAIAGVAVALSAVLGVALRRTRKVIFRVFKIDENARKVVEGPVVAITDNSPESLEALVKAEADAERDIAFLRRGPQPKKLSWPKRFIRALLVCAFLIFTVFIMGPLEVVASSSDSLSFGFLDAAPYVITVGVIAIFAAALLLSFIPGRAFDAIIALIVALGICAYVQALFLNGSLPVADGKAIDLMEYKTEIVTSTAIWLAIIVGFLVLNAKGKQACRALGLLLSAALLIVQGVSLGSITLEEQEKAANAPGVPVIQTTLGLDEVGSQDNVIVFVLDFFDTRTLEGILNDDPQTLEEFTGFTYFRNSTGSMIPTRYGLHFLLTGELPREDDTFYTYTEERYERSSFLEDIAAQGYDIGIYSDSVLSDKPTTLASNYVPQSSMEMNAPMLIPILEKVALYRDLPWLLKPFFWFYTDEINRGALVDSQSAYIMDDIAYGSNLRSDGLTIGDDESVFRFIHLLGAHYPYIMDAEGNAAEEETDIQTQGHGSLMIVADYLRELKRLGLYDSATIIVTSDHGDFGITDQDLTMPVSPILLAKPTETAEEAAQLLIISNVPTGHLDFTATIIDAIGGDTSEYGSSFFEIAPGKRPRYYWMTGSDGTHDIFWREFEIDGHVLDFDSWELTGKNIDIPN